MLSGGIDNGEPAGPVRTLSVRVTMGAAGGHTVVARELQPSPARNGTAKREPATTQDRPVPTLSAPGPQALPDEKPKLLAPPEVLDGTSFPSERGSLVVEVSVDSAGDVTDVRLLRSELPDDYSGSVMNAIASAKFRPARHAGQPVDGQTTLYFEYRPDEPQELRYEWITDYLLNAG